MDRSSVGLSEGVDTDGSTGGAHSVHGSLQFNTTPTRGDSKAGLLRSNLDRPAGKSNEFGETGEDGAGLGNSMLAADSDVIEGGILNPSVGTHDPVQSKYRPTKRRHKSRVGPSGGADGSVDLDDSHKQVRRIRKRHSREFKDEWRYTRNGLIWLLLPIMSLFAWVIYLVISLT